MASGAPTIDAGEAGTLRADPAKVVVVAGPDEGQEVPLGASLVVGSGEGAGLVLHDPLVSRQHAKLTLRAGRVVVEEIQPGFAVLGPDGDERVTYTDVFDRSRIGMGD